MSALDLVAQIDQRIEVGDIAFVKVHITYCVSWSVFPSWLVSVVTYISPAPAGNLECQVQ